jgi:WD40 repeat protein
MAGTTANKVYCTAWSPDGALLATGHWWKTGDVRIWDAQLGAEVAHLVPKESAREDSTLVSWMAGGSRADVLLIGLHSSPYLAPVDHDSAELWNPMSGSFVSNLGEGAVERRSTLALCAERHLVALIESRAQGVVVRDLYDREARIPIARADHRAVSIAWSPDGAVLAVAYDDGRCACCRDSPFGPREGSYPQRRQLRALVRR